MTRECQICAKIKPRYYKNDEPFPKLIKATTAFERLSIDFKGPVPSNTNNRYILTVIDEYSRFPCSDMSAKTVIKNLNNIFMMFGMPAYVHSDRGTQLLSAEVRESLNSRGIATSRTTAYNPQGNGQVEKLNSTVWKALQLVCESHEAPIETWEQYLPVALHSIRSLLCAATNCTPHERMFLYTRRSPNGNTIPSWLTELGHVLMKRFDRKNKYQPLVEEVEILQANPDYSFVKLKDGRETTVSNRHLAPIGQGEGEILDLPGQESVLEEEPFSGLNDSSSNYTTPPDTPPRDDPPISRPQSLRDVSPRGEPTTSSPSSRRLPSRPPPPLEDVPRRSERARRLPRYLEDYSMGE